MFEQRKWKWGAMGQDFELGKGKKSKFLNAGLVGLTNETQGTAGSGVRQFRQFLNGEGEEQQRKQ